MRRLIRPTLTSKTLKVLSKRTASVTASANQPEKAAKLWCSRKNKSFSEIKEKLASACSGRVRCMYCEDSEATDIEHFYPKSSYPLKAFDWVNYLLACSNCNSNYKRTQFPLSATGAPELLNPFDDEPFDHFELSPSTGKLVALTTRAKVSVGVFGLDRQTLEDGRKDAWITLCALVAKYNDLTPANDPQFSFAIVEAIRRTSFSCVARFMHKYFAAGTLGTVAPASVISSLDQNPELLALIS